MFITYYGNPMICVEIADGSVRLCLDARHVNKVILSMRDYIFVIRDCVLVRTHRLSSAVDKQIHKLFFLYQKP